jgi:hypothetical protein
MKRKFLLFAFITILSMTAVQVQASKDGKVALQEKTGTMTDEQKQARAAEIEKRAQEIKDMDKSNLSRLEKKDMRDELRNMNKESKAMGNGGIYLSIGGILLIILVLILIL